MYLEEAKLVIGLILQLQILFQQKENKSSKTIRSYSNTALPKPKLNFLYNGHNNRNNLSKSHKSHIFVINETTLWVSFSRIKTFKTEKNAGDNRILEVFCWFAFQLNICFASHWPKMTSVLPAYPKNMKKTKNNINGGKNMQSIINLQKITERQIWS